MIMGEQSRKIKYGFLVVALVGILCVAAMSEASVRLALPGESVIPVGIIGIRRGQFDSDYQWFSLIHHTTWQVWAKV